METIEEKFEVIPNINYNVYNALNLACEDLGERYLETGFNPFGEHFMLDEQYITDSLLNGKNTPEIKCPEFVEQGEKACNNAFSCSLENCTTLLAELEGQLNNPDLSPEAKAKLQKIITYLKMRIELLVIFTQKQKKNKNKFVQYKKLLALNYTYGDILEDSYTDIFDAHAIANQLLAIQLQQTKQDAHHASIIEQAKQIIANNQKNLEQTEQKVAEPQKEEVNQYQQALNELNTQKQAEPKRQEQAKPQPKEEYKKYDDFSR